MYPRYYYYGYGYRYGGVSPGDVAAGVVGGAIGTAGAPFGYDEYNYYAGPYPYAR